VNPDLAAEYILKIGGALALICLIPLIVGWAIGVFDKE